MKIINLLIIFIETYYWFTWNFNYNWNLNYNISYVWHWSYRLVWIDVVGYIGQGSRLEGPEPITSGWYGVCSFRKLLGPTLDTCTRQMFCAEERFGSLVFVVKHSGWFTRLISFTWKFIEFVCRGEIWMEYGSSCTRPWLWSGFKGGGEWFKLLWVAYGKICSWKTSQKT